MKENKKTLVVSAIVISILIIIIIILYIIKTWPVSISIVTNPSSAEIYINNKMYQSPATVRLKPGNYTIWAIKEGYMVYEKEYNINRNNNSVDIFLESDPEANIPPEGDPL